MYVVGQLARSHWTNEPNKKPDHVTVRVTSGLRSGALVGKIDASTGTGLFGRVGGGLCQSIAVPAPVKIGKSGVQSTPLVGEGWTPIAAVCPSSWAAQLPPKMVSR